MDQVFQLYGLATSISGSKTLTLAATLTADRTVTLPDAAFTLTGGGTLALGGFTLTVPATGTAVLIAAANTLTGANVFQNAAGIKTLQAATQDGVQLLGRAGGTGSWFASITPLTLTASRTWSLPDRSDTFAGLGTQTLTGAQTISNSTASTSPTTGSLINGGGFGCTGAAYFASYLNTIDSFRVIAQSSNTAAVKMDTNGTGFQVGFQWNSNGVAKWTFYKDTDDSIALYDFINSKQRWAIDTLGNMTLGVKAAMSTSATDGFVYIPTCAGAPTGVPTSKTGMVPMVYDTTNNKFYIYNGAWKSATLT